MKKKIVFGSMLLLSVIIVMCGLLALSYVYTCGCTYHGGVLTYICGIPNWWTIGLVLTIVGGIGTVVFTGFVVKLTAGEPCPKHSKTLILTLLAVLVLLYLPLVISIIFSGYDLLEMTMSRIGWQGGGMFYLISIATLGMLIFLYQLFVYIYCFRKSNKFVGVTLLAVVAVAGRLLNIIGGFTPYRVDSPEWMLNMHDYVVMVAYILNLVVLTYLVLEFIIQNKNYRIAVGVTYAMIMAGLLTIFFTLGTRVVFQLTMTTGFIITMLLILVSAYRMHTRQEITKSKLGKTTIAESNQNEK